MLAVCLHVYYISYLSKVLKVSASRQSILRNNILETKWGQLKLNNRHDSSADVVNDDWIWAPFSISLTKSTFGKNSNYDGRTLSQECYLDTKTFFAFFTILPITMTIIATGPTSSERKNATTIQVSRTTIGTRFTWIFNRKRTKISNYQGNPSIYI